MTDKEAWAFEGRVLEWLPKKERDKDGTDVCTVRTDTEDYSQLESFPIRYLEDRLYGSVGKNVPILIAVSPGTWTPTMRRTLMMPLRNDHQRT